MTHEATFFDPKELQCARLSVSHAFDCGLLDPTLVLRMSKSKARGKLRMVMFLPSLNEN